MRSVSGEVQYVEKNQMHMQRRLQWWASQRQCVPTDLQVLHILIAGALNPPHQDHHLITDWQCYFSCKSHVIVGIR